MHNEAHPQAGETVKLTDQKLIADVGGDSYIVEDWWDRICGKSWMDAIGNPAAIMYALRNGRFDLPIDDEVVYGKVDGAFGHILHVSQLGEN